MKKKKVAVYIRIPKNDEAKLQIVCDEYRSKIAPRRDCKLVEIFYDVGMSGIDNKRPGYLRMLEAARNKEFDYIVTKHSGKLSRRAVELISLRQELSQIGIGIYFEDSGMYTLQMNDPLEDVIVRKSKSSK